MKNIIIVCTLFSLAAAAVIPEEAQAQITKYQSNNDGTGNYNFSYETSNGISREETGYLVNVGTDNEHIVVRGSYSYIDVDGKPVLIRYTADENGYHIELPNDQATPPLMPILDALPAAAVASLLGK